MILVDAGPLIALLDADDRRHDRVAKLFRTLGEPLVTTWPALTEAFYMLGQVRGAHDRLWELVGEAPVEVAAPGPELHARMRELMEKYRDLPMDLADASLVAVGEQRRVSKVLTVDRRDFAVYRPRHRRTFTLLL